MTLSEYAASSVYSVHHHHGRRLPVADSGPLVAKRLQTVVGEHADHGPTRLAEVPDHLLLDEERAQELPRAWNHTACGGLAPLGLALGTFWALCGLVLIALNLLGVGGAEEAHISILLVAAAIALGCGYSMRPKTVMTTRTLRCSRYDVEVNRCGDAVEIELVRYWHAHESNPLAEPVWWRTSVLQERHDADDLSAASERLYEIQQQAQALTLLARADYEGIDLPGALSDGPEQLAETLTLLMDERKLRQLRHEAEAELRQLAAEQSVVALQGQLESNR